jgi:glycosyltransferase involved in cell wall biosynthesis
MADRLKYRSGFAGVIPNAAPIVVPKQSRDDVRKILEIGEGDIVCIFVGRLTEEKGLRVYADAMESILTRGDSLNKIRFVFAGEGPMEDVIRKRLPCFLNNIRFLGARSDVQDLLCASDIFVFPSLHENLSYSLLEACAAGIAIIATDVGGNPEVIRNGVDGVLVQPSDPKGLEQHILWLANDRSARKRLGASARDRVNREFTQDKTWSQLGSLYVKVLNGC